MKAARFGRLFRATAWSSALGLTAACARQESPVPFAAVAGQGGSFSSSGAAGSGGVGVAGVGVAGAAATRTQAEALLDAPVVHAEHAVAPSGGTLVVTADSIAVAADADRASVFVVELSSRTVRKITLDRSDEPGRAAEGAPGVAYVVLRGAGALAVVDTKNAVITSRVPVCAAPRGVAFDAAKNVVHVACRSGRLVTLDAASLTVTRSLDLDADLRDVVVIQGGLFLTRFRSADLLVLDETGSVVHRARPEPAPTCESATVAYRAVGDAQGHVAVAHQLSSNLTAGTGTNAYGRPACGSGSIVMGAFTLAEPNSPFTSTVDPQASASTAPLPDAFVAPSPPFALETESVVGLTPPYDVAIDRTLGRVAFVASGSNRDGLSTAGSSTTPPELWTRNLGMPANASGNTQRAALAFEPVAVAFDPAGHYVVQSREPAVLSFESGEPLSLTPESVADSGLSLFQLDAGLGVACASCHPEGDEDGHTWHFTAGLRRTLPLRGGVLGRAPFHWNGELADMTELAGEVMVNRMGLPKMLAQAQVDALGAFLDQLPEEPAVDAVDAASAARGSTLFTDATVGCATCHRGPELTDNLAHDVGTGGALVTPSLLGVGLRSPLFHDGCTATLTGRFGVCGGGDRHGVTSSLTAAQAADLVEYLKTL